MARRYCNYCSRYTDWFGGRCCECREARLQHRAEKELRKSGRSYAGRRSYIRELNKRKNELRKAGQ